MSLGLVLGGGGLAGIAWELGLITGLRQASVDVTRADLIVGTSAGSVVGTWIATGADLNEQYDAQFEPSNEISAKLDLELMMKIFGPAMTGEATAQERRARLGAVARTASEIDPARRREVISGRLPSHDWPDRPLILTAINTANGEFVSFDAASGVDLVDAVAASCAVPGVWPPTPIGDSLYMDGGLRSPTNAELAIECDQVLIIAPTKGFPNNPFGPTIADELKAIEAAGHRAMLIDADEAAAAVIAANALDPASRPPAAKAGRRQASGIAEQLVAWLA